MTENEPREAALCQCADWQENIRYLRDMILLRWMHGGKGYEGKPFVYCPWCGNKLAVETRSPED